MKVIYHHRTRGKGAEGVHIMGIVDAFRTLGHTVNVLSVPGSTPEPANTDKPNQPAGEAPPVKIKGSVYRLTELTKYVPEFAFELVELLYNLVAFWRVGRSISRLKPDLIYERYSLFMFAGVWQAKRKRVSIILEVNDAAIVERVRPLFFAKIAQRIERWTFSHCDGIAFISSNFKKTVLDFYGDVAPAVVCPNAANISQFSLDGIDSAKAKRLLGLDGKVVCGYVGAFVYWHGIDWFVKEIAPRLSKYPELALLLVGDGVVYDDIKQLVASHGLQQQVIMPGRVAHSEVKNYIAAMDYGILPDSNQYGSPMKLFEMMAMGVALVSPAFEPITEVVTDNENGWLFPPKDRAAAVEKVLQLSQDQANIRRVGEQASQYICTERQWTDNVTHFLGLLK